MTISDLSRHVGETVTLKGWLYHWRKGGKIWFLVLRDGSGYLQCVVSKADVPEAVWEAATSATQESTLEITGVVKADARSAGGVELGVTDVKVLDLTKDWPITPKEHGVDFLMSQRHLWLRSSKQVAVLKVRSEVESAIHDFFYARGFTRVDSPILTPAACEGTSNLFETQYTDEEKAYLSQSGQLYLEPAAAALGKVYCFGPTFRAEKSKTRRHLREFWMVEPEVAFLEIDGLMEPRRGVRQGARGARPRSAQGGPQAARARHREARARRCKGVPADLLPRGDRHPEGEGLPACSSATTSAATRRRPSRRGSTRPSWSRGTRPRSRRSTCSPTRQDPDVVLGLDMLAPEGYGEIIGGSQRIHDHDLLLSRIQQHNLPLESFQWYLDVRKYGTFPHSGFGMGLERFVAWMCGVPHLREVIPYPRMLYRIYP